MYQESRGVIPSHADQQRAHNLCARIGAHHAAKELGLSRIAMLTLAARLPVYLRTLQAFRERVQQHTSTTE
jgi:ribosomal protein S14